jgi:hypothetical protein
MYLDQQKKLEEQHRNYLEQQQKFYEEHQKFLEMQTYQYKPVNIQGPQPAKVYNVQRIEAPYQVSAYVQKREYKLESNSNAAPSVDTAGGPSDPSPMLRQTELGKTPAALVEVTSDDDSSFTLSHVKITDQEFVRFFDEYLAKLDEN